MATARQGGQRAVGPDVASVRLKFGGGINSRASAVDIDPRECSDGQNFELQRGNSEMQVRRPVELLGTAPNGLEIRGFVNLLQSDGTITALVQAGGQVYTWDGADGFTALTTVDAASRLRGPLRHSWPLDDLVIVTDLTKTEVVKTWNGTSLSDISFLQSDGSTAFGSSVYAKYCAVEDERVWLANITAGSATPHLIVGSQRGSYTIISVADRPSSSLSNEDPFFLIQPDYRPINGFVEAFGRILTSSENGGIFSLTGTTAQDFAFGQLFPRSGARGTESVAVTGNDVVYGRVGRIESLRDTDRYGDVESNDLSLWISDKVEEYKDWTTVYNSRTQVLYAFPSGGSECFVYFDQLRDTNLSPWSRYTSTAAFDMQPTTVMSMLSPADGLEYVMMGDVSGNVFRMEGSVASTAFPKGDVGGQFVRCERLSGVMSIPEDQQFFDVRGFISHRNQYAATVTLRFEVSGESVFDRELSINVPAVSYETVFGGEVYFNDGSVFGTPFDGRLRRRRFGVAGLGNQLQVRATVESNLPFQIEEIFLEISTATAGA